MEKIKNLIKKIKKINSTIVKFVLINLNFIKAFGLYLLEKIKKLNIFQRKIEFVKAYNFTNNTNHQKAPGTISRPILYAEEASQLSEKKYLQNWQPENIILPTQPDYIVEKNTHFSTIQLAVNAAIKSGKTNRQYIFIKPGTYKEIVYIPKTNVPITIYGDSEEKVKISLTQGANMSLEDWSKQVNPNNKNYKAGDPAWSMYESCVKHTQNNNNTIGTQCSSVVWAQNDNFQLTRLSVQNSATGSQAVALSVSGDKTEIDNVALYGFQDTLYLGGSKTRMLVNKAYVTGYTDFIFGSASVIFKSSVFKIVLGHGNSGLIFAPNTSPDQPYGFLVSNSYFTGEKGISNAHFGRGWDTNLVNGKYVPGVSANGQVLIENTKIDKMYDVNTPWSTATSQRQYKGNITSHRNLNDSNYNRMWEYANTGDGA